MGISEADVARWKAFGGSVQEAKGRKTFVAPSGKRLKTWKEAQHMLEHQEDNKKGVCRKWCLECVYSTGHGRSAHCSRAFKFGAMPQRLPALPLLFMLSNDVLIMCTTM